MPLPFLVVQAMYMFSLLPPMDRLVWKSFGDNLMASKCPQVGTLHFYIFAYLLPKTSSSQIQLYSLASFSIRHFKSKRDDLEKFSTEISFTYHLFILGKTRLFSIEKGLFVSKFSLHLLLCSPFYLFCCTTKSLGKLSLRRSLHVSPPPSYVRNCVGPCKSINTFVSSSGCNKYFRTQLKGGK